MNLEMFYSALVLCPVLLVVDWQNLVFVTPSSGQVCHDMT